MKNLFLVMASIFISTISFSQNFDLRHDHTNVLVSDLEISGEFYKNILHLKEMETPWGENPQVRFFDIGDGRQIHMVEVEKDAITVNKITHLAFNVQDFEAYLIFLNKSGIEYFNFSGTKNELQIRPDDVKQVYFQDPDGNWIEVNDAEY